MIITKFVQSIASLIFKRLENSIVTSLWRLFRGWFETREVAPTFSAIGESTELDLGFHHGLFVSMGDRPPMTFNIPRVDFYRTGTRVRFESNMKSDNPEGIIGEALVYIEGEGFYSKGVYSLSYRAESLWGYPVCWQGTMELREGFEQLTGSWKCFDVISGTNASHIGEIKLRRFKNLPTQVGLTRPAHEDKITPFNRTHDGDDEQCKAA